MFCSLILDKEWNIKHEEDRESDCLQFNNVPRPGSQRVKQGGEVGFVRDEKIIAANGKVDEEDDNHVDIRPNENALEGLQGGTESLHNGHVDGDVD